MINYCHSGRSPSPQKIWLQKLFVDTQFQRKSRGRRRKKREASQHRFRGMQHAMLMPLWGLFSGQPRWVSLSSLGTAASPESSLLFSSGSLMHALFLKWSPWPHSSLHCLISPTLLTPCVCFESLPPSAPWWGSGIIRPHCYQLFCCFGRRSLHIRTDWFRSLLFSLVSLGDPTFSDVQAGWGEKKEQR